MKKLIPAIVMLLVSAVVLSTASYAWFTTSQDVVASGMSVTAEAPTSILISGKASKDSTNWSTPAASVDFSALGVTTKRLYAASSYDGETFLAPDECEDFSGSIKYNSPVVTAEAEYGDNFYMDYYFKLQNTSTTKSVDIAVENIALTGGAIKDALRVAILVKQADGTFKATGVYDWAPSANNWVAMLDTEGKVLTDNQDKTVYAAGPLKEAGAYATNAAGVSKIYDNATTKVVTIPAYVENQTAHEVEMIIRVWIEGQDSACITNNADQTASVSVTFGILPEASGT